MIYNEEEEQNYVKSLYQQYKYIKFPYYDMKTETDVISNSYCYFPTFKYVVLKIIDDINEYYETLPLYTGKQLAEKYKYKYEKLRMLTDREIKRLYRRLPEKYKKTRAYFYNDYGYNVIDARNRKKNGRWKSQHNIRRFIIQLLQNKYFKNIRLMDLGRLRGLIGGIEHKIKPDDYDSSYYYGISKSPI